MRVALILVPPDQFFSGETQSDHHELEIKPIRLEPKEQMRAEDDRERKEAQNVMISPGPGQQQVECICEQELSDNQVIRRIYLRPIPAPIRKNCRLEACLQIVLRLWREFQCERSPLPPSRHEQNHSPRDQHARGAHKRPEEPGIGSHLTDKPERSHTHDKDRSCEKMPKCVGAADFPPCITARRGGCVINKISRNHRKRRSRGRSASATARSRNSGFLLCSQPKNHLNKFRSTAPAIALQPASFGCRWSQASYAVSNFLGSFG